MAKWQVPPQKGDTGKGFLPSLGVMTAPTWPLVGFVTLLTVTRCSSAPHQVLWTSENILVSKNRNFSSAANSDFVYLVTLCCVDNEVICSVLINC